MINNRDKKKIKAFGKHIRKLRLEAGLSQEELNHRTELSKNMVGMIERGEVNPTLTTIQALAKGLALKVSTLVEHN